MELTPAALEAAEAHLTAALERRRHRDRLSTDLPYFAEHALRIRTRELGQSAPLNFNAAQQKLHAILEKQKAETGRVRAVVLKGRQLGISTYVAARFYQRTIFTHGVRTFIVAHSNEGSRNLYGIVKRFQDQMPDDIRPSVGVSNATELLFDKVDSGYLVSVAAGEGVGRSATAQFAHLSELAFWDSVEDHFAGLLQTIPDVPGSEVIIESTAFGFNEFYRLWRRAEAGEIGFIPIFLPWHAEPGYRSTSADGFEMTQEETDYAKLIGLDVPQMAWRRRQIALLGEQRFRQEYPASPTEAFVSTDFDSFIPAELVQQARQRKPEPSGPLIIGFDPAYTGADRHAMVWRRGRAVIKVESRRGLDTMQAAGWLKSVVDKEVPYAAYVDVGGVGAGVVDRLREQGYGEIVEGINFGSRPIEPAPVWERGKPSGGGPLNRRAEMWQGIKDWLSDPAGVSIPDRDSLASDLSCVGYKFDSSARLVLEPKDALRKRGLPSPDEGDALALTFALGRDATDHVIRRPSRAVRYSAPVLRGTWMSM